ncbi:MAG: tetratricopeptide repeat protein [Planctomycetaceae bacterium]
MTETKTMTNDTALNAVENAIDAKPSERLVIALTLGLIALTLFVYARVLTFEFVNWDDDRFIVKNIYYPQGLTKETVWWALTSSEQGFWIPTTRLSFLLDGQMWKMHPAGFHLTNLMLHIINTILCSSVCRAMFGGVWKSFFIAAIFAVHPIHAESVCWVNDRNDLVCGLFWMLAMLMYLSYCRTRSFGKYLLLAALMSLSVMSKPQAATFPFAMLLLDLWPLYRWKKSTAVDEKLTTGFSQRSLAGLFVEKIPLIALCVFFMGLTWHFKTVSDAVVSEEIFPLNVRVANAVDAYAIYARQMFWPGDLQFFYPHYHLLNHGKGIPFSHWGISLAIVLSVSLIAVQQFRKRPYLFVGWCWFLGILVPAIGLIQVGTAARADRYMYIPMMGLTIVFVQALEEIFSRMPARRPLAALTGLLVIAGLSAVAIPQAKSWKNTEAMCIHALKVDENNYAAYINLGHSFRQRDAANEEEKKRNAGVSLEYLEKARRILPGYSRIHNNIALSLLALGRDDEAYEAFRTTLKISPDYVLAYQHIANMYVRKKDYEQAVATLLEVDKRQANIADFEKELAWVKLAYCYRCLHQEGKALEYDRKIYALNPRRFDALERIAWALATSTDDDVRNSQQALELANKLNQLYGEKSPVALDTLAAAHAEAGNFDEALKISEKARDIARRANNEKLAQEIEQRHQLYQAGKPFRQTFSPTES